MMHGRKNIKLLDGSNMSLMYEELCSTESSVNVSYGLLCQLRLQYQWHGTKLRLLRGILVDTCSKNISSERSDLFVNVVNE